LSVASVDFGSSEGKIFFCAPVDETDLIEFAKENEKIKWDEERGIIVAQLEKQIGALVLSSKQLVKMQ